MNQLNNPYFLRTLDDTAPLKLEQPSDEKGMARVHDEAFVRDLIHRAPGILPIAEIEPVFEGAKAVCIELPNPVGFVDNLLITSSGGIVLVECKLQRNPQARREVIGQILDYAAQLSQWTYEDLERAVQKAETPGKTQPASILSHFDKDPDFDPITFIDAVTRNLRRGRMLLLIVGDGIRQGLDNLASYLQLHPGFHATIGLVELRLYNAPNGGYFVQPRTLMKTLNIERGIIRFDDTQPAPIPPAVKGQSTLPQPPTGQTLSEEMFFEELAKKYPGEAATLKLLVPKAEELGIVPEYGKTLIFRWIHNDGRSINLCYIRKDGMVYFDAASWRLQQGKEWDKAEKYREKIAAAVGGTVQGNLPNGRSVYADGKPIRLPLLLKHQKEWLDAVQEFTAALQDLARQAADG